MSEFAQRRQALMQKVPANSIIILMATPITFRNHHHEYPYRQNSDFYYLTGFEEPEAALVLLPQRKEGEFVLFNRVRDHKEEIWNGYRSGQEGACKNFGAAQSFPINELSSKLPELLEGRENIYYSLNENCQNDKILLHARENIRAKIQVGTELPQAIFDIKPILHEMRVVKSQSEIALMRKAAEISAAAHRRAMQTCKPGMNEYQLEAEITYEFQRHGARFCAYTSIVGSGANSCILHYNNNDQIIQAGDMVLIDAGCEYQYYASDVTRTFPANGHFSPEQKAIYEIVLAAQLAGIEAIKPGLAWSAVDDICVKTITQGLIDLGLLKGELNSLIEQKAYFPFYMHRSGHWLGLDTHDAGRYKIGEKCRKLEAGMVRTVEPGIYIAADNSNVDSRWHNIGIRIEDDILVTENGYDVLSQHAPKAISEIENLMSA